MELEFFNVSVPKSVAFEIYRALLGAHIMEMTNRRERGLEDVDDPPVLQVFEKSLGISPDEAHRIFHEMENELWEYGWYSYTDEWAWWRARREVIKELGAKAQRLKRDALERLIEERYEKDFERFVAEIDMQEPAPKGKRTKKMR